MDQLDRQESGAVIDRNAQHDHAVLVQAVESPGHFTRMVGVEGGQLDVVAMAAAATAWSWRFTWYPRHIIIPASAIIASIGLFWAIQRGLGYGIESQRRSFGSHGALLPSDR